MSWKSARDRLLCPGRPRGRRRRGGTRVARRSAGGQLWSIIVPVGPFTWRPERVVLGVVDVPRAYIPQTVPSGQGRWPYWSKAAIVVRANSPRVVVTVPKRIRGRVAIGWGNVDAANTVTFSSCPASSSLGPWNPYSGGFLLRTKTACVPLTFTVAGRSATVRFGVGKRCS